jgi:hypothetical protein
VKAEPDPHVVRGVDLGSCPYSRLQESGVCLYDGVRNYQARNGVRRCVFFVNFDLSQWQEAEAVCASAGRQPPLPLTTCHKTITHRAGAARSVARWDKHKRRCIEDVQRHFCVVIVPFFFVCVKLSSPSSPQHPPTLLSFPSSPQHTPTLLTHNTHVSQALLPILTPTHTHLADTQHTRAHHAHTHSMQPGDEVLYYHSSCKTPGVYVHIHASLSTSTTRLWPHEPPLTSPLCSYSSCNSTTHFSTV